MKNCMFKVALASGFLLGSAGFASAGLHDSDADFYGRTGDLISIDLAAAFGGGSSFTNLTFNGVPGFDTASTSQLTGSSFSSTGKFFVMPSNVGGTYNDVSSAKGFQGVLAGSVKVDGVTKTFELTVRDGYTGAGRGAVVDSDSKVAVAGQQHRLNYFGYPTKGGDSLAVDGSFGPATTKAVQLFQGSFNNRNPGGMDGIVGPNTTKWLNAKNAPHWVELVDPDPQVPGHFNPYHGIGDFDILPSRDSGTGKRTGLTPQIERWATSWTIDTILAATAAANGNQVINGMSTYDGWGSSKWHHTHQSGMDIDLNVPGSVMNFGNGSLSSDEKRVADEMVAFVENAAEGCEVYHMIMSNSDIRGEFNRIMDLKGYNSVCVKDDSGVHKNHVHIDIRVTGAVAMAADAKGDFNIDGGVNADDIDLLYKNLGGDAEIFNLAGTSTAVTQTDVNYLVRSILDTEYADANLDGSVSFEDFSVLMDNYTGELAYHAGAKGWVLGDWDGDWDVDTDDLGLFDTYQNVAFTSAQQAIYDDFVGTLIPEPMSGGLMLIGGMGLLMRRRRA